jgi:hypothetical protein
MYATNSIGIASKKVAGPTVAIINTKGLFAYYPENAFLKIVPAQIILPTYARSNTISTIIKFHFS